MKLILALFVWVASGDVCQDFCRRELGSCGKGSYCKKKKHCHALFWTGNASPRICMYTGDKVACPTTRSVLCSEAVAEMGQAPSTKLRAEEKKSEKKHSGGPTEKKSEKKPGGVVTEEPSSLTEKKSEKKPSGLPTEEPSTPKLPGQDRVELMTDRPLVWLHDPIYSGRRPHISVKFSRGANEPVDMFFDTGSSHTLLEVSSCPWASQVPLTRHKIVLGCEENQQVVKVIGITESVAQVAYASFSEFIFSEPVILAERFPSGLSGGILGAGRDSNFAKSAGTFAFIPSSPRAQLLIGQRDLSVLSPLCRGPMQLLDCKEIMSYTHWVVTGSVSEGTESQTLDWLVDTGAPHIYLPQQVFNPILTSLLDAGMDLSPTVPPAFGIRVLDKCDEERRAAAPPITFRFGDVQVIIPASEYLLPSGENQCTLWIAPRMINKQKNIGILGMGVIRHLVTVFDNEHSQIGFCNYKD